MIAFQKVLSKNDTGESGSHQAGILVPKGNDELLSFFPVLDSSQKNPDKLLTCVDEDGQWWKFRYVYYNNKLHEENGTRNEFRITRMTSYLRNASARAGDRLTFELVGDAEYRVSLEQHELQKLGVTKLSGWRRVH